MPRVTPASDEVTRERKEGTAKAAEHTRPSEHPWLLSPVPAHTRDSGAFLEYRDADCVGYKQGDEKKLLQ